MKAARIENRSVRVKNNKKVGNAHRKLLACPSLSCVQTMQNGKIEFEQFPIVKKGDADIIVGVPFPATC